MQTKYQIIRAKSRVLPQTGASGYYNSCRKGVRSVPEIIVAALSMLGTAIGSITGVMAANKLTNYRIEQLEKQVAKHNTVIERTFKLEEAQAVLTEQIKVANHRIGDLERED